jgi:hypothetical protein
MTISMYQASVPLFKSMLNNLSEILLKAQAYADKKKIEEKVLLETRLFPDMFPLVRQVQIATDIAKSGAARLAGIKAPVFEDNETSLFALRERIAKVQTFLNTLSPEQIDGSEEREVRFAIREHQFEFAGQNYLTMWVLPNLFFHITTAYNLLRHNGLDIGKRDYLGKVQ